MRLGPQGPKIGSGAGWVGKVDLAALKVSQFRKDFLLSSNSPKKQTNEFDVVVKMNSFVHFLGEFEGPKLPLEII